TTTTTSTTTRTNTTTTLTSSTTTTTTTLPVQVRPRKLKIDGKLVVKEMDLPEIIEAGINLSNPANYHVYKYETKLTFGAEQYVMLNYVTKDEDGNKEVVRRKIIYNGEEATIVNQTITVNEEMYMIVTGECKWLKEFYEVQLIVINNDDLPLNNCRAVLNVPDGLTLVNSTAAMTFGDLGPGETMNAKWYVRGDKAGDYNLSADFTGYNKGQFEKYVFRTENPLHVYAGNALKMTVYAPTYSFYREPYTITIALTNQSDKPIYGLTHTIKQIEQSYEADIYIEKKIGSDEHYSTNGPKTLQTICPDPSEGSITLPELDPNEVLLVRVTITDMWYSVAERVTDHNKLVCDFAAMISSFGHNPLLAGPNLIATMMSAFYANLRTEHVLQDVAVTTLEGSTTEIPYEIVYEDISDELKMKYQSGNMLINVMNAGMTKLMSKLPYGNIGVAAGNYEAGVLFAQSVDEVENAETKYITAIVSAAGSKVAKGPLPLGAIATVFGDLEYMYKPPVDCSSVQFGIIVNDSTPTPQGAPGDRRVRAASTNVYDLFDISIEDGDYTVENGNIYLNGPALIRITPKQAGINATISLKSDDGSVNIEKNILTVPEHECVGRHTVISHAHDGNPACEATFCEVCGAFMAFDYLPEDAVAMLSTGENFSDVKEAVAAANAAQDNIRLYLFGEIDITENITVNGNVDVWIVPDTIINIAENCAFETKGTVYDYRDEEDKNTNVKIRLNYWDGRSEIMEVENGTTVSSLPGLGNDKCAFGGWFKDSGHTAAFEPFVAGEHCNYYEFYADIDHHFNSRGRCSVCGELKNGKDAFIKVGAVISDNVALNVIASLSPEAAADKDAYAEFRLSDDKVFIQKLSDAADNGDGTYTFSCSLMPTYIDNSIRLQIHYSNGSTGSELTYSVRNYLDALKSRNVLDEDSAHFVDSLINYAERLKEYAGETVAEENDIIMNEEAVVGNEYKAVTRRSGDALRASYASLTMNDRLGLTVKFTLEEGKSISDYRFTVDGRSVRAVQEGNIASISVNRVTPDMYGIMHTFRAEAIDDQSVFAEVDYSAFTYAKLVMEKSDDEKLINVMKALVIYGRAADRLK
ncbi:MAG: hypothetical protein IKH78_08775, partial [Ruminococcus sp.]|nr:hypothetical protein [Ruminococcus sp.]